MLSTRTTQLLKSLALAVGLAALVAPAALADHWAGKYGSLDPGIAAAIRQGQASNYGPLDPGIAAAIRQAQAGKYGPLDPGIAAAIRTSQETRIASPSRGQNGVSRDATASVPVAVPNGFDWADAGIGAAAALAVLLLAACTVAAFVVRRSRARLAGL